MLNEFFGPIEFERGDVLPGDMIQINYKDVDYSCIGEYDGRPRASYLFGPGGREGFACKILGWPSGIHAFYWKHIRSVVVLDRCVIIATD